MSQNAAFQPQRLGFNPRSGHVGFVVDIVALGEGFLRVLRFPLPILIPSTAPYLLILSWMLCSLDTGSVVK
jgi:hypothetical protein